MSRSKILEKVKNDLVSKNVCVFILRER